MSAEASLMVVCPLEVFSFLAQEILTLSMDALAEISTGNCGWTSLVLPTE